MAPGVSSGKRSMKVTQSRLYEGTSATQQVITMGVNVRASNVAWIDPSIDYNKPWFEERDEGMYCLLCHSYATEGHVASDKHKGRAENPSWYGPYGNTEQGGFTALDMDARYSAPWFENKGGEWYCHLCSAWATEGHVGSEKHRKREAFPQPWGYNLDAPGQQGGAAAPPPAPGSGGAGYPSYTGRCLPQNEAQAYADLMREYTSKPWFEQRDGEWYCNLCGAWATEGHIGGDKHQKRSAFPSWYGFDDAAVQAATGSAQRSESPLPENWTRYWNDEHQRPYYYNRQTTETVWDKPRLPPEPEPPPPPPPAAPEPPEQQWQEFWDENHGQYYYHNRITNVTTWARPPELPAREAAEAAAQAPTAAAAPAQRQDADWERFYSTEHNEYYYVDKATGHTQWDMPAGFDPDTVDC